MRSPQFIAAHRGGLLSIDHHRLLAIWAADCAEHLLPIFEKSSSDDRPRLAIAALGKSFDSERSWQLANLPLEVRELVKPELLRRFPPKH